MEVCITGKFSVRTNRQIIAAEVRVIDENGEMVGLLSPSAACTLAQQQGLDLVEISPKAVPPVCKIMDYGKYKYEQQKKLHEAKKKQKVIEIKELKIRPNIADGDYEVKVKSIRKFIDLGDKVRVILTFRGRELAHTDVGFALMQRFLNDSVEFAKVEVSPKMEGKNIFMVLVPK